MAYSPLHPCSHWHQDSQPPHGLPACSLPTLGHSPLTSYCGRLLPPPVPRGASPLGVISMPTLCSSRALPLLFSDPGCLRAFARATFAHREHLFAWIAPLLLRSSVSMSLPWEALPDPQPQSGPCCVLPQTPALAGFPQKQGLRLAYCQVVQEGRGMQRSLARQAASLFCLDESIVPVTGD